MSNHQNASLDNVVIGSATPALIPADIHSATPDHVSHARLPSGHNAADDDDYYSIIDALEGSSLAELGSVDITRSNLDGNSDTSLQVPIVQSRVPLLQLREYEHRQPVNQFDQNSNNVCLSPVIQQTPHGASHVLSHSGHVRQPDNHFSELPVGSNRNSPMTGDDCAAQMMRLSRYRNSLEFDRYSVESFFDDCEDLFAALNICSEKAKFLHVRMCLDRETRERTTLRMPHANSPACYVDFKELLISLYSKHSQGSFARLNELKGKDVAPDILCRELLLAFGAYHDSKSRPRRVEESLKRMFLDLVSRDVAVSIRANSKFMSFDQLVTSAVECYTPASTPSTVSRVAVNAIGPAQNTDSVSDLASTIAKAVSQAVSEQISSLSSHSKPRIDGPQRDGPYLCRNHKQFGDKCRYCCNPRKCQFTKKVDKSSPKSNQNFLSRG